jgi:hypothetical protein
VEVNSKRYMKTGLLLAASILESQLYCRLQARCSFLPYAAKLYQG